MMLSNTPHHHARKIRVLVVDDSAFMRSAIKGMIGNDPELEVVSTARDGQEAIEKIERFSPDVVTMDIEMPRMDGLTAIRIIMEKMPRPILVVSSLTKEGAQVTLDALDLGAVDYITKDFKTNVMDIMRVESDLVAKIKTIARRKVHRPSAKPRPQPPAVRNYAFAAQSGGSRMHNIGVIAIGVSTGGPKALQEVIPLLPRDLPAPVLVVQHMPAMFTGPFAERLNALSGLEVKEAQTGDVLEPGKVFIARGGMHMRVHRSRAIEVKVELSLYPEKILYRPSVNVMMHSVVEAYGGRILGVIMTGMGNDGTDGMRAIKQAGGKTLAQDEASCVVYGMPKSVVDAGLADKVAPLSELSSEIVNMV